MSFSPSTFTFALTGSQPYNEKGFGALAGFTLSGFSPDVTNIAESAYTCTGNYACSFGSGLKDLSFANAMLSVSLGNLVTGQTYSFAVQETPQTVPEPDTLALLGSGLLGLVLVARRRKR